MIRLPAGIGVTRFCSLAGIPRPTWYRMRERALGGQVPKGPWPRAACNRVEVVVPAYALRYPAWGDRKIWVLTVADGHSVSMRTVHRILDERGLIHPARYQAERRELAKARRATFHEPPTRRNHVWQTRLELIASELQHTWPDAAGSLREGLPETLTLMRLGITGQLARTLCSTNPCESMIEIVRYTRCNVGRRHAQALDRRGHAQSRTAVPADHRLPRPRQVSWTGIHGEWVCRL